MMTSKIKLAEMLETLIAIFEGLGYGDNYGIRDARGLVTLIKSNVPDSTPALRSILKRCDNTIFGYEYIVGGLEEKGLAPPGFEQELYRLFTATCKEVFSNMPGGEIVQEDVAISAIGSDGVRVDFDRASWTPADERIYRALEGAFLTSLKAADQRWAQAHDTGMYIPMLMISQRVQDGSWSAMLPHYKQCLVGSLVGVFSRSDCSRMKGGPALNTVATSFDDFLKSRLNDAEFPAS